MIDSDTNSLAIWEGEGYYNLALAFVEESIQLTDLDRDKLGEISFAYQPRPRKHK